MGGADTGFLILEHVCGPRPTAEVVVRHHERPDGSGYPRGLTDREICQAARAGPGRAVAVAGPWPMWWQPA